MSGGYARQPCKKASRKQPSLRGSLVGGDYMYYEQATISERWHGFLQ